MKTNSANTQSPSQVQLESVTRKGKSAFSRTELFTTPALPAHKMLAKRYELKYRISESLAQKIKGYVSAFLTPDPYNRNWTNGQYPISSLYFDSSHFDLFRETQLDKCNRFKLRIRGYDDNPDHPVFFEIKRKLNGIIYKSRARAGKNQIADILNGHYLPPEASDKDCTTLKQFVHYVHSLRAKPIVQIRYLREAFEGDTQTRSRVTFDRQLCFLKTDQPVFQMNGRGWRQIPIDFVVMEIKFTDSFPAWLMDMSRLFDLNRQSMSKYGNAVKQMIPTGNSVPMWQ